MINNRERFKLSVIVPCFNEQDVIRITHMELIKSISCIDNFEIIYINDGSSDTTLQILLELRDKCPYVKIVSFSRNFGHQPAVLAGLEYSSGDCVAIIDADLQDPPHLIPKMVDLWRSGYDVIYAVRKKRKESLFKRFAYFTYYRLQANLSEINIQVDSGDFSLIDKRLVNILRDLPERNKYLRGLRAWTGFKQKELIYERNSRKAGVTKYSYKLLLKLAINGITNFSTIPLRIVSVCGLVLFSISILLFVLIFIHKMVGFKIFGVSPNDVPGWTSIILFFLLFSSMNFIFLGIIGEYMAKIYEEVKNRPSFIVDSIYGFDNE
jgi:dolichol-phosphate mannosyltransferase